MMLKAGSRPVMRSAGISRRQVSVRAQTAAKPTPVCVVTGGSRGIGSAVALALGKTGAKVVVNYSASSGAAEKVASAIVAAGGEAIVVGANISKKEDIDRMFKEVMDKWGRVDVLVNNAGITKDGLMMTMKPAQWQEVIDINLTGAFFCMQAATKIMGKQKSGRIVNMSSVVGVFGNAGQANYSASKGGLITLTKTVAKEYAARGITCNVIAPGFVVSDMTAKMDKKYEEATMKTIPLGRYGQPEEIAGLTRYLALDPSAAYITGQCFNICGGICM